MTLWILFCRMQSGMDTLFTFYARSHDDAEQQARKILVECGYEWIDLKAYPGGFVIHHAHIAGDDRRGECVVPLPKNQQRRWPVQLLGTIIC